MNRRGAYGLLGVGVAVAASLFAGAARAEPIDGKKVASYIEPASGPSGSPSSQAAPPAQPLPREQSSDGPFDPFRLGAFTGVGFPRPVSIEGFIKIDKIIGFGLEYSLLPQLTVSGINTQLSAIMGDVRVFPLETGFFIGMGVGRQHLSAISATALPAELGGGNPGITMDSYILNPRIGFLSTWSWGLTLGIDAGVQIPVSVTTQNTIPSGISFSPDPTGVANAFGKSVLPTVDLLRIGLLL
jgi:hypothetical protein